MIKIKLCNEREGSIAIKYNESDIKYRYYDTREVAYNIFCYMKQKSVKDRKGYFNKQFYHDNDLNITYALDVIEYILKYDTSYKKIAAVTLHLYDKKTYEEIADIMNMSKNTLTSMISSTTINISNRLIDIMSNKVQLCDMINQKDLSVKTFKILQRGKYFTNKDLIDITYEQFIRIKGAGEFAWDDLTKYMDKHDIKYHNKAIDGDIIHNRIRNYVVKIAKEYRIPDDIINTYNDEIDRSIDMFINRLGEMVREARI
jgi:hypothetical protein